MENYAYLYFKTDSAETLAAAFLNSTLNIKETEAAENDHEAVK